MVIWTISTAPKRYRKSPTPVLSCSYTVLKKYEFITGQTVVMVIFQRTGRICENLEHSKSSSGQRETDFSWEVSLLLCAVGDATYAGQNFSNTWLVPLFAKSSNSDDRENNLIFYGVRKIGQRGGRPDCTGKVFHTERSKYQVSKIKQSTGLCLSVRPLCFRNMTWRDTQESASAPLTSFVLPSRFSFDLSPCDWFLLKKSKKKIAWTEECDWKAPELPLSKRSSSTSLKMIFLMCSTRDLNVVKSV